MAIGQEARVDDDPKYVSKRKGARTTRTLRDMLFEEIEELRSGDGDPQKALAISKLAGQIVNIARAEMEFYRLTKSGERGPADLLEGDLPPKGLPNGKTE